MCGCGTPSFIKFNQKTERLSDQIGCNEQGWVWALVEASFIQTQSPRGPRGLGLSPGGPWRTARMRGQVYFGGKQISGCWGQGCGEGPDSTEAPGSILVVTALLHHDVGVLT